MICLQPANVLGLREIMGERRKQGDAGCDLRAGSQRCPGRIKKLWKPEKIDLITHHSEID